MSAFELLEIVILPATLALAMPFLVKLRAKLYWLLFGGILALIGAVLAALSPTELFDVNGPLLRFLFLFAVPLSVPFLVSWSPRIRERSILIAIAAPFCFLLGLYVGISVGVTIGALEP